MEHLRREIERLFSTADIERSPATLAIFQQFRDALTTGKIRAAEKRDGQWRVNVWVKQGILLGFRLGELNESSSGALTFVDKDTFPPRNLRVADGVRIVPGGSAVRQGAYVAASVICM